MKLDSALELKHQLMSGARRLVARGLAERRGAARPLLTSAGGTARKTRTLARSLDEGAGVAMGVAPLWPAAGPRARAASGDSAEYKLAVRVFGATVEAAAPLLAGLSDLAPSELELVGGLDYRPRKGLSPGNSCGHFEVTAGTLGLFVEDDRDYYLLSNNHVLANSDKGKRGDPIWSPGPADAAEGHLVIAHLTRWPRFKKARRDNVDAALASLSHAVDEFYPWHYQGIGEIDPRPIEDRFATRRVIKRGRTTGVTRGTVSAFDLDGVRIPYGAPAGLISFDNQLEFIHKTPKRADFSAPGDSGSLILDADSLRPYALLFGGGADSEGIDRTLGHFLAPLLQQLKVRLVT